MRVLFVDDDSTSVKGIIDHCAEMEWECCVKGFDESFKEIMLFNPDVVVLDWCAEPGDDSGMPVLESIWTNGYRPIVIFSGNTDIIKLPKKYVDSKLIKMITKGDEEPVVEYLDSLKDMISAISSFRNELGESIIEAFRIIESIQKYAKDSLGDEVIKYLLAKRAVNYFDLEKINIPLPAWSIYQYPPVINDYLTVCDVLRSVGESADLEAIGTPENYKILLTPSCDMVVTESRKAKVENVLYADCKEIPRSIIGEKNTKINKIEKKLKSWVQDNEVPLPALENVLPDMIIDMKRLGTVDINSIAVDFDAYYAERDKYKYVRVCSIDSPFREQIVWTFLKNIGRIGVPERDYETWAKSFMLK